MSFTPLLILHAVSLLVGGVIIAFAVRYRRAHGVQAFAVGVAGQMLWTFGYACEVLTPSLAGKVFWDDFQLLGTIGWVTGFFRFAVRYTDRNLRWLGLATVATVVVCGGYLVLAATDPWHGLVRPDARLVRDGDFVALVYSFTVATWVPTILLFFMLGACVWMLFTHSLRVAAPYRPQSQLVASGTLVPLVGIVVTMLGVLPSAYRDVTPLTFSVGDALIAWGLFRHRLLELVPVARDIVFENLSDAVVVVDAEHRVVDVNAGVVRTMGRPRSELIGRPDVEVFSQWGEQVQELHDLQDGTRELTLSHAGELRHVEVQVTPLRGRSGRLLGRVLVAHDVTERRRVQRELEQKNEQLKLAFEELDAFSYSVSHDLRAPLRAVGGFSRRLAEHHGAELDGEARELVERIQQNARRMQQLIEDLLGFARLGRQALGKQPLSTRDLVRDVIADLNGECEGRDVEIVVGELPDCVADRSLLRQVFTNLIGNAIKYTRPRQKARIEIGARPGSPPAFYVKDNGVGFEMQYAERLFGVFQRLHAEKEFEGTGIGLASAKQIVTRHGGRIWAEARLDEGATFFFTLAPS